MLQRDPGARLLVVPGLNDSGPAHWQTWLQARTPGSVRVRQRDWQRPDLDTWADAVSAALRNAGGGPWIAVAHSFGCLALVRHLQRTPGSPVQAALLVAAADPAKFGLEQELPHTALPLDSAWVASTNDPWMSAASGRQWAERWGCHW